MWSLFEYNVFSCYCSSSCVAVIAVGGVSEQKGQWPGVPGGTETNGYWSGLWWWQLCKMIAKVKSKASSTLLLFGRKHVLFLNWIADLTQSDYLWKVLNRFKVGCWICHALPTFTTRWRQSMSFWWKTLLTASWIPCDQLSLFLNSSPVLIHVWLLTAGLCIAGNIYYVWQHKDDRLTGFWVGDYRVFWNKVFAILTPGGDWHRGNVSIWMTCYNL